MRSLSTPHRGFSLVEVLVVVTLTGVLAGVSMTVMNGLANWGNSATESSQQAASLYRMEQTLRKQLAEATRVEVADELLVVSLAGGTNAEWTLVGSECQLRTKNGDRTYGERYRVGPHRAWRVEIADGLAEVCFENDTNPLPNRFRLVVATSASLSEASDD